MKLTQLCFVSLYSSATFSLHLKWFTRLYYSRQEELIFYKHSKNNS